MKNNNLKLSNKKTFIVAEIGNNHEGSFNLAKKLIDKAKDCGVDAVKFQTFIPTLFYSNDADKKRMRQLKKFSLSFNQFHKLAIYTKKKNLTFFSTPLDYESAQFLNGIQKIFKIASSDNNYFYLIEKIAHFNKDIIVSTGLSDIKLLKKIEKTIIEIWKKKNIKKKLAFTHCVSSYPTNFKDTNLGTIKILKKEFPNRIIGYSDHTIGIDSCLVAAAFGAKIIEKHFTIDNNYSKFRDHKLSANPNEMKTLVDRIRNLDKMKIYSTKKVLKCEKNVLKTCRRFFAAGCNLKKGSILTKDNIIGLRSTKGISVLSPKMLLNRKIKKNLPFREIINMTDLI
jgi:N,N'-diacetyllegionaminate synthase